MFISFQNNYHSKHSAALIIYHSITKVRNICILDRQHNHAIVFRPNTSVAQTPCNYNALNWNIYIVLEYLKAWFHVKIKLY